MAARAVSVPSLELFAAQPLEYRNAVLPPTVPTRLAVEAAAPQPWYRWVGDRGAVLGIERFGASAPYQRIYQELGLTVENVVRKARSEEHTSELQSQSNLVCRLLLEKKKTHAHTIRD